MSDDINQLVQAASTSLFSPESLDDIRCRLSFIEASECNCGEGPHENAIHDLIKDDVPVLFHVIHCLAAELEAARAEVERLQAGLASVEDFARVQALSDRVRSGPARSTYHSEERYWLDLLALIERAQGARP